MSKNTRKYPARDAKKDKDVIRELKAEVRRLQKVNAKLVAELKTVNTGFKESIKYINDELASIPVEDIVKYFARKKKGKLAEVKATKEDTRRKFQQWLKRKQKEGN